MLMPTALPLGDLENPSEFIARHIGISAADEAHMLSVIGEASRRALIDSIVPRSIARARPMELPAAVTEAAALAELKAMAQKNQVLKSFIGQGYYGTHTPGVILRNILENPAWYTAYTPYQAEISQGRMEALVNFQTMVTDLTGMAIANASMLDEATAAAEAMTLARRSVKAKGDVIVVAGDCHPQTIEVIQTRAKPLGLTVKLANSAQEWAEALAGDDYFAVLAQYPSTSGRIDDLRADVATVHGKQAAFIVAADLLALTLLVPPGEFGADIVVGTTQRFGMPMGAGGPHAAYMACRDEFKRSMPGPPGGRERGRARQPGLPPGAADARAAHPPREGHLQHLHRAGAAGRGGQHVRGLPRPAGPEAHRAARGRLHRHPGRRPAAAGPSTTHAPALPPSTPLTPEDRWPHPEPAGRAVAKGANLRRCVGRTCEHVAGRNHHARRPGAAVGVFAPGSRPCPRGCVRSPRASSR
jgi:hypothetical protein